MSQTAIPLQFETYMRNQIVVDEPTDMNEMIFANIPDLDPGVPIDRTQGLPDPQYWVHQQDVDQVGKLGDNALVHSVVIANDVAEFTFNAIYMHDKTTPNSCGMVVHTTTQTKLVGQALTKSLMQQYLGAAEIANVTIDASTWMIDYSSRLSGIDEDHRLACLDNYGHTAYVDGFDVERQGDPAKYKVATGVVYIGGLRCVLTDELLLTIVDYPNGIYVDVHRDGTPTSKWVNIVEIKVSDTPLADYVDGNGFQHYVARLAGLDDGGLVKDWRRQAVRSRETQVVNRLLGNQNCNVVGKHAHPVPSATEYTYPEGQEIAAGWLAVTECKITKVGKELSGTGIYRRTFDGEFPDDYFALKRVDNSQDQTGIEITAETGKTHLYVDLAEAGTHMFPGSNEVEGVWPSVGDDESTLNHTVTLAFLEDGWSNGSKIDIENIRKFKYITLISSIVRAASGGAGIASIRIPVDKIVISDRFKLADHFISSSEYTRCSIVFNSDTQIGVTVAQSSFGSVFLCAIGEY